MLERSERLFRSFAETETMLERSERLDIFERGLREMGEKSAKMSDKNSGKTNKRNRLNLRIDDDDLETLTAISFEDDESISQIVRKAIKQYYTLRKNRNKY